MIRLESSRKLVNLDQINTVDFENMCIWHVNGIRTQITLEEYIQLSDLEVSSHWRGLAAELVVMLILWAAWTAALLGYAHLLWK